MHSKVRRYRTTVNDHMLAAWLPRCQVGYCGCSKNPQSPDWARMTSNSSKNLSNLSPMLTWAHSRNEIPGMPRGWSPLRTGRGPPAAVRAMVYVSHGGPPPAPTIWPESTLSLHQGSASGFARSPDCLCMQRSIERAKIWVPSAATLWSIMEWMSSVLR